MNILHRAPAMPVFYNLEFEFAQTPGVEFDVEVAQEIAERVAQRDGGRYNHSHASSFQRMHVGIEDISEPLETEDEYGYDKNLLLPSSVVDDPNPIFAREVQGALDEREHANRMNIPGTIGMFAVVSAVPGGMAAVMYSEKGLTSEEVLASAGIGVGFTLLAIHGHHAIRNAYRRIVTGENYGRLHKAHLERAVKLARKLELPPVISAK